MRLKSLCMFLISKSFARRAGGCTHLLPVNIFGEPAEQDYVVSAEALQQSLQDFPGDLPTGNHQPDAACLFAGD